MLVEEVMAKEVVDIDCNKTVYEACEKYSENKVGCLVVMDNNIIVGIITERDIIERVILQNKEPKNTKIMEIMSQNIKTVHALSPVEKAAEIMRENNIKKLPVILNNEIVGIITVTDISRAVSAFSELIDDLTESYEKNREMLDNMMDEWAAIITSIKHYQNVTEKKQKITNDTF